MEIKQWWRPSDTLYNFIMQCAKRNKDGKLPLSIQGKLDDCDVHAGFHANSRNFEKERLWELDFNLYSREKPRNLEGLVITGVKAFGGSKICMASAKTKDGVEIYETLAEIKRGIVGFPWIYSVEKTDFNPQHKSKITKLKLSNKVDLRKAAEVMQGMMDTGERAHIYADKNDTDSQIIIYANDNKNRMPHGIFMRKSRAGIFSDFLNKEDIQEFDETAANTGYNFKGKEWNVELFYEGR